MAEVNDDFKIKKKKVVKEKSNRKRMEEENDDYDFYEEFGDENLGKVTNINPDTVFENIIEEANRDRLIFTTIQTIINLGNKELKEKITFWQKKKTQLKISNLSEQEYRERETQIIKDEKEEIKEIKQDIIHKLSISQIRGFENFDNFAKKNFKNNFDMKDFKELQEMEKEYKSRQLTVLERLLNFNYFKKKEEEMEIEDTNFSEKMNKKNSYQYEKNDEFLMNKNKQETFTQAFNNDGTYQGREKKLTTIKLSKYIGIYDDFEINEKKNIQNLQNLTKDKLFKLTKKEIQKINNSKNHKTYYDENNIKKQYEEMKEKLVNFYIRVKNDSNFCIEKLSDEDLGLLINASSFSLNSIHFKTKFHKSEYIISPNDLIYLVNKILNTNNLHSNNHFQ